MTKFWNKKYTEAGLEFRVTKQIKSFSNNYFSPRIIQIVEKYANQNDKILEAGCGTGRLIISLMLRNNKFVGHGVDLSDESVNLSQRLCIKFKTKAEIIRADMIVLPYSDNFFDIVFCDSVLEHIQSYEKAFQEIARVTKPLGYVIATVPNKLRFDGWELYKYLKKIEYLQLSFTPWHLKRLFKANNLKVIEMFGEEILLSRNFKMLLQRTKN